MKKSVFSLLLAAISPAILWAQGINFTEGSFSEVLAKAKKENKIVFVDVYTTWCGPCKKMAKEFFPTQAAGDKYNTSFVNYKIDAEQGEGVSIAKKYHVQGYPTSLYLKPDGSVVYTSVGMSTLDAFLENADVAIAESKDPMKLEDYAAKFKKGNEDKAFLVQYLQKTKRLGEENDLILDKYVTKYLTSNTPGDEELLFLIDHTRSIDNKAYALLSRHADHINQLKAKETPDFFQYYTMQALLIPSAEQMGKKGDIKKFDALVRPLIDRYSKTPELDQFFYREYFYRAKGSEADMEKFQQEKAQFFSSRSDQAYAADDKNKQEETILSLKNQLITANVPAEQHQAQIDAILEQNPSIHHIASYNAANELNQLAWNVYEQEKKAQYTAALQWSKRAMQLIRKENIPNYAAFQDTYAHLLFVNGQKEEAIKQEMEALESLKAAGITEGLEEMEAVLNQMKEGKL